MIKHLISEKGTFYKANLHCHSTVSDGELTPEQLKQLYSEHGYSVVAFTDHNVFVTHNELSDENFLALNGVENAGDERGKAWKHTKCCDINFIALDKDATVHPLQDKNNISGDPQKEGFSSVHLPDNINRMIKTGVQNNFFVTYNHPTWSLENFEDYMSYNGMHAMEIYNHSSVVDGYNEYNPDIYDDMLRGAKRIYALATDDNHNRAPNTCHWDSFGGFTMIKAPALTYESIAEALLNGNFYASRGPVINALYYDTETNLVHIECEKAEAVICTRGGRRSQRICAGDMKDGLLTAAEFNIERDDAYLRFTVVGKGGLTADTNAYFVDQILK